MLEASETAHAVKILVTMPDDLSPVSGTHTVEGETQLPKVLLGPPHMYNSTLNK